MSEPKLAGGPTQDEVMAVSLFKLGLTGKETVLEIGCGTGQGLGCACTTCRESLFD